MSNRFGPRFCYSLFVFAVGLNTSALADEGMWLFNAPPLKQLKEKYQFEPTPQWLEHLQKASVRFNSGGSGSFISANGLVITNHHVGADTLQKMGDAQHNYLRDGFYAKTQTDEMKSTDLELNVLVSIEDVTARAMPLSLRLKRKAKRKPGCALTSLRSTKAALIICIDTNATMTCGSFSRLSSRWLFSAETRITLSIPATIWTFASFAFMKKVSPRRSTIF